MSLLARLPKQAHPAEDPGPRRAQRLSQLRTAALDDPARPQRGTRSRVGGTLYQTVGARAVLPRIEAPPAPKRGPPEPHDGYRRTGNRRSDAAAALLAQERDRAAAGKVPVLRVSFIKLLELMRPLWLVFPLGDDLLEDWQKRQLTQRFYAQARRCLSSRRRARSCPRAVRQPVSSWPRLLKNTSSQGPITVTIIPS